MKCSLRKASSPIMWVLTLFISVADPDPPDPHIFGPPGSGSTSQRYGSGSDPIIMQKNLDSYYFVTLFDYLSLKNDVNVPSKSNKQKNCVQKLDFAGILKVNDENSRIRIRIRIH